MKDAPTQLETAAVQGKSLRCCSSKLVDRYSLVIEIVTTGEAVAALSAVDAAENQPWPPSPLWQELHVHDGADGQVLMFVGRAGKSHWSMSVSLDADHHALIFDVACRLHEPPGFLGTTYQLSSTDFQVRARGRTETRTDLEIRPTTAGAPSLMLQVDEIAGIASATIEAAGDLVIIRAPQIRAPQPTQPQATVRWKYRLSLRDDTLEDWGV